jgi:hypothetical protein
MTLPNKFFVVNMGSPYSFKNCKMPNNKYKIVNIVKTVPFP